MFHSTGDYLRKFTANAYSPEQSITNSHAALFFWSPVIMCIVIFLPLFAFSDLDNGNTLLVSVIAIIFSIFIGFLLRHHHIRTVEDLLQTQEKKLTRDITFQKQVFPIWSRQISTSRTAGDEAVAKLTMLFSGIVSKLENMLKISKGSLTTTEISQGHEQDFLEVVARSQEDIKTVFSDLKEALETVADSKDMLLAEITMYSVKMKEMAAESSLAAFQSQIIALNAEIEAARAGEAGWAFGAVVTEMRQLANQSSENSKAMAMQVESIDGAMTQFYKEDKEVGDKEKKYLASAESVFKDIMERFNTVTTELEKSINTLGHESQLIRNDISSALVQFQYQDRVSQILDHVSDDIDKLLKADPANLDAKSWITEMTQQFSVDEEHRNLSEDQTNSSQSSSLTFF